MNGNNGLKTRNDAARVLLDIIRPLKSMYSEGKAWLFAGATSAHYGSKNAAMEGFSRILWGLGPLWAGGQESLDNASWNEAEAWRAAYREGILNGTNPASEEYWGDVADFDQKMVEMAALVTTFALSPDSLWNTYSEEEKKQIHDWLDQINGKDVHPNNWRFFRILTNMTFRLLGQPWSRENLEKDLALVESCFCGDGWYFDGRKGQMDYYIPFAMHFYGLVYAAFTEAVEPEYSRILKERGKRFAEDFIYWFGGDGNEVPFGRSLTYRFAHSAFFSAMAFAGEEGPGWGVLKHLVLANLREWLKRPIFDNGGVLSIGYHYPNLFMSERYNAPGSPYWSFKTFLMLALPEDHPFWQAGEEEYPYEPQKLIPAARMLITHNAGHHVQMYPAGHHGMEFGSSRGKYEKFVYSNQFGFCVERGVGLEAGGFDSTLAVADAGDDNYRMRYGVDDCKVNEDRMVLDYHITDSVAVRSTVIPCGDWHVRIHEIQTGKAIDVADGGFSIGEERPFVIEKGAGSGKLSGDMLWEREAGAAVEAPWGTTVIRSFSGGTGKVVKSMPNLNLFFPLSVYPSIISRLEPGSHCLIRCVAAHREESLEGLDARMPAIQEEDGFVIVHTGTREIRVEKKGEDHETGRT